MPVGPAAVTAVLLAREDATADAVDADLRAIAAQSTPPDRVLLVLPPRAEAGVVAEGAPGEPIVVRAGGTGPAAALAAVLDHLRAGAAGHDPAASLLWLLPVGSLPGRAALEAQVARLAEDPDLAVVGAKHVRRRARGPRAATPHPTADDADGLVDVGITLTRGARIVGSADRAEIDQGQDDWRRDVLAVGLAGMLVREDALRRVGGLDPALDERWASIELCHRLWRGGRRVEVVPAARVLAAPPDDTPAAVRSSRAGRIGTALALRPAPLAIGSLLLLPLITLARMLGAVVGHRPRRVLDELAGGARALRDGPGIIARSARASRRARVPRRRLAPLFLPRREAARRRLAALWAATLADDDRSRRIRRTTWGVAGTSHGADDADFGRHTAWTLALGVLAAGATLVALRPVLRAGDLTGPGLVPLPADPRDTWQAAWHDWVPGGLGTAGPADPLVRVLAHLPVPGPLVVDAIILGALPAAALAAWWAAGALTRAVGARLALAAAWALAPSALGALADGRWPLLLVHVLLPLLALAVARAVGLPHKRSQASVSAAGGAGLLLLVIGAVQPVLVLLALVAIVLIVPAVPGRRRRLAWVLLPSLALHVAYLPGYVGSPGTLLAVGGQLGTAPTPADGPLGALWPAPAGWPGAGALLGATGLLDGPTAATWLPILVLAPLALAALAAPFLAAEAGRVGRFALVLAGLAVGTAVLAARVPVDVVGERALGAPPHALISAALLGVLLAAGCTFDALARRDRLTGTRRRRLTAGAGALVAVTTVLLVLGWATALPGALRIDRGAESAIPAAAADQGRSSARLRTLVLGNGTGTTGSTAADPAAGSGRAIEVGLVVGGGTDASQRSARAEARLLEAARTAGVADADPASGVPLDASARLLSGDADTAPLRDLAVGYVVVPATAPDAAPLVTALDASPLLERVTEGRQGTLWRVVDQRPRATLGASAEGGPRIPLSSDVIDAEGTVTAAPIPRTISLAERADPSWRAELDGRELDPVTVDGWAQGFLVPAGAQGHVSIESTDPFARLARILLYAVVAITALVAVPWRGRAVPEEDAP